MKRLQAALVCFLLPATLAIGSAQADGAGASGQPVVLRVQAAGDWYAGNANAEALAYRKAHEQFLRDHPNIKVELEIVPGFERYKQFIVADEAGDPPDVTNQGAANTYALARAGRMLALNQFMEGHPYLNPANLKSAVLDTGTIDGKHYVIPTTTDIRLLYYRKDLMREAGLDPGRPPATREDLIEAARRLTRDSNGDGAPDQWGYGMVADNTQYTYHFWAVHLHTGGGEEVTSDGKAVYDGPAGVEAARLYRDLVNRYKVTPVQVVSANYEDTVRSLVAGQYATAILGSWTWERDLRGGLGDDRVGWTRIPIPRQGGRHASFSGGWSWMISAKTRHPKEAWEYIAAINNEEVALELGKVNISTRQSVLNNPQLAGTFVSEAGKYMAEASYGNPKIETTQALFDGVRKALQEIIQGKADPEAAIKAAAADYNSKYYRK